MVFIGIIGFVLSYSSWGVENQIKNKTCTSSKLKNSNRLTGVIGVTCIVAYVSYFVCIMKCGCDKVNLFTDSGLYVYGYLSFILAIGITIIVLGSIIHAESKGDCKEALKHAREIWGTGIVLVVLSAGFMYLKASKTTEDTFSSNF